MSGQEIEIVVVGDDEQSSPATVRSDEQQNAGNPQPKKAPIFRIPLNIYNEKPADYTPSVVGLGPYHVVAESSGNDDSIVTVHDKLTYREEFLGRCNLTNDDILAATRHLEGEIRDFYSDNCDGYDSNALMEIMVRDSCFVIEYFRRIFKQRSEKIKTVTKRWNDAVLQKDLILLENQLPFFLLDHIYTYSGAIAGIGLPFLGLTLFYFQGFNLQYLQVGDVSPPLHFTCILRSFLIPESSYLDLGSRVESIVKGLSSADELSSAGLDLQTSKWRSWLKIDFRRSFLRSTLTMGQFSVGDQTEIVIRNVMELERCCFPHEAYVSDYIFMLHFLIREERDAKALMDKDIIVYWGSGPTDVVRLVQSLITNVDVNTVNTKYNTICVGLKSFLEKKREKRRLKEKCWGTPKRRVASIAGFVATVGCLYFGSLKVIAELKSHRP